MQFKILHSYINTKIVRGYCDVRLITTFVILLLKPRYKDFVCVIFFTQTIVQNGFEKEDKTKFCKQRVILR